MSLIIGLGRGDVICIAGDKRAVYINNGEINDDKQKVYEINKNAIVGYAGIAEYCELILGKLIDSKYDKDNLSFEEINDIIVKNYKYLLKELDSYRDNKDFAEVAAFIMLGGKNNGTMTLRLYHNIGHFTASEVIIDDNYFEVAAFGGNEYNHHEYTTNLIDKRKPDSIEDVYEILQEVFKNGSKFDNTINDKITFKVIKK